MLSKLTVKLFKKKTLLKTSQIKSTKPYGAKFKVKDIFCIVMIMMELEELIVHYECALIEQLSLQKSFMKNHNSLIRNLALTFEV